MPPTFLTNPLALIGLASLPALAVIYLLRNRFRRYPVSSLMLWVNQKRLTSGGRRFERLQTPLLFFLELLILALFVLAAAGPRFGRAAANRPLVVVLDDSFSMLAGGKDSTRLRAAAALLGELRQTTYSSVRFVLAGLAPQI